MATPAVVTLVLGGVATLLAVAGALWFAYRRIRSAFLEVTAAFDRLDPAIERLQHDSAVSQRELDRIGASLDRLRAGRHARKSRGRDGHVPLAPRPVDSETSR